MCGVAGLQRHIGPGLPLAVALGIDLQREGRRGRAVVAELDGSLRKTFQEECIRRHAGLDGFVDPDAAAADGRPELVGFVEGSEPEVRLRLAGAGERALGGTLIEEFGFRGVVAAEDEAVLPAREVADDLEVGGARRNASRVFRREAGGEFPKEAMHGHQARAFFADVADTRPLGIPAMRTVIRVAAFG